MAQGVPYKLLVERWDFSTDHFQVTGTLLNDVLIHLDYVVGTNVNVLFDGFTLNLRPYRGQNATSLSLDYNLTKPGHPLNDPTVGVARGTATISSGSEVFTYFNFYVNTSLSSKLRIRLQKDD